MKKILVLGLGLVMGLGLFSSQAAEEATEKADVTTYKVAMKGVT